MRKTRIFQNSLPYIFYLQGIVGGDSFHNVRNQLYLENSLPCLRREDVWIRSKSGNHFPVPFVYRTNASLRGMKQREEELGCGKDFLEMGRGRTKQRREEKNLNSWGPSSLPSR